MVTPSLEGTQVWYPLGTVLLPEKMWCHRALTKACSCPGVRLQGVPELGTCVGGEWTAVWDATRPGGWYAQPCGRAKRGCRKVKNYQGLRAIDWLVEPLPTISQLHHQKGKIPYHHYYQLKRGNLKRQVRKRGLGATKTQWIRFVRGSRWIPSQPLRCPQYIWGSGTWGPDTQQWGWKCNQAVGLGPVSLPPRQWRYKGG